MVVKMCVCAVKKRNLPLSITLFGILTYIANLLSKYLSNIVHACVICFTLLNQCNYLYNVESEPIMCAIDIFELFLVRF